MADQRGHRRLGVVERRLSRNELVGDAAERVEVGVRPDLLRHRLLGRHVLRRPDGGAGLRQQHARVRHVRGRLGDPEVGDLDGAVGGHHHVLGLEITVHDPSLPRRLQPREQPVEHAADLRQGQRPHVRPQRPSLDVLHRDVRHAVMLEEVEDRDDVRVLERPRKARLAHEAPRERRVGGVEAREFLQGHVPVEISLPGEVHGAHAPAPQLADDPVAPDGPHHLRHGATLRASGRSREPRCRRTRHPARPRRSRCTPCVRTPRTSASGT